MRTRLLLLLTLLAAGCAHRVRIESQPPGASVRVGKRLKGPTPQELTFLWVPFRPINVRVSAAGYRTVVVKANKHASVWRIAGEALTFRYKRLLGLRPRATIEVMLIRDHGPVGTWTEEDIRP